MKKRIPKRRIESWAINSLRPFASGSEIMNTIGDAEFRLLADDVSNNGLTATP